MEKIATVIDNHRISLSRIWDKDKPYILFIGLNPSIADAEKDDPTVTRLINFSKVWGFGGLRLCNLYTRISTDPKELFKIPVDELNHKDADIHMDLFAVECEKTVFMWGSSPLPDTRRERETIYMFDEVFCFGKSKKGKPKHPLYLPKHTQLIPFN